MIQIPLTQGKVALIDDDMFDRVLYFKWYALKHYNTYYASTYIKLPNGNESTITMHRLIYGFPNSHIDHVDGNGLINTKENTRLATNGQNQMNRQKTKNASSHYKGVSWIKADNAWKGSIKVNGINMHLGYSKDQIQLALRYDMAAIYYFGEFAKLNF
jgi:hypothetical protein